jgi:hypothetical protein
MKRIEGGQDGIQYISKGSQQFATEGNFLFMSTNDIKQSFHVKTGGGILLENKKNKVHLQENGARLDLLYLEENILGDSTAMIGGNYWLKMTDKKGQMRFTDFHKYQIVGDTFEIDVAKFMVKRGGYGIDWENDLIVSNPSQIKFMSLNGDINFSTKNGERIIFENEKPNGVIEFRGERSLIKTGLAKMEHQTLQITCPNIQINRKFIIEEDGLEVQMDAIQLRGQKMEIGCIKMRGGDFWVRADELQLGAGEDTKIEITRDKVSIIGEGNLGIMLIGGKGGIKMLGDLQWIHMEDVLIQTNSDQKMLQIGAESWKLRLEGAVEIENCTLIGKNRRVSGELCEIFGDSSVSWQIGDKIGQISAGGIVFESGVNRLDITSDCIREIGVKKRLQFERMKENGIRKTMNWDLLEEKGGVKKSEWELLEARGIQKKENWESVEEELLNYSGLIRGKYELVFEGSGNGIYWDSGEFGIRGVFKKNDRHTIFGGDNKLIIENAEIEIRNCLRWKDNELLIGIGRRSNNIFLTEGVMLLGGKDHHLAIMEDKINIGGSIFVNSQKQVFIGDTMGGIGDSKDKKIVIGLQTSSLLLDEKQAHLRGKKVYLSGGESMQINGKNVRIQGGAIGIGSSETGCIEFVGEKMVYRNGGSQMAWGDDFLYTREGGGSGGSEGGGTSRFNVGEKGVVIDSDDGKFQFMAHIKAPINLHSMRNINIESTIGNIQIKNHGSQIFMNNDEKMFVIWSEDNIWVNSKKIMMEAEKIEIIGKNIGVDCKMDVDIRFGRKLEALGGKEIEFQCREGLKMVSELFGELRIGAESELNVRKSLDVQIGENYGLNVGGSLDFAVEKDLKIRGKMLEIGAEDGVKLVSGGAINLEGGGEITMKSANFGLDVSEGLELLAADRMTIGGAKQMLFQQRGFGEMCWEADGKIRMISKIEGNRGDVMEIRAESNTHEKSIYLCSRIGGIYLEGQTIGLGGKVQINGVEIVGGENRLAIGGMVEASGLKIGKNMFIEPRGISLLQREELELRNMDVKLGGRLDAESLKVKKILGGAEVDGKMRVIGGIETKGGIVGDGVRLGNWDGGNRSCLKIDMKGTVWNEGVNISGGGRSIVVDGDIVCGGGGRILANSQREGRQDIGKLLEEVAAMGDSGTWDVGRALQKLAAIVGILVAEKEE